jgi:exopolysaccharide production protein ExoZ
MHRDAMACSTNLRIGLPCLPELHSRYDAPRDSVLAPRGNVIRSGTFVSDEKQDGRALTASVAGDRIVSLQVLRFAAATGVIALHAWQILGKTDPRHLGLIGEFGPAGVDMFFVLSGFIITSVSRGKTAIDFLRRRLTRVLPLYWFLTAVMMIIQLAAGTFDPHRVLASFLFVPTLGNGPYILTGWTLCFEILFYLCFAITLLRPKLLVPLAIALYVTAAAARELYGGALLQFVGNPLILEFLGGCLIAMLPRSRTLMWLSATCAIAWSIIIIANGYEAGAYQPVYSGDAVWLRVLMWGTPAFLLVYFLTQVRLTGGAWKRLSYLGDASYSAYLVHDFILILLVMVSGIAPPGVATLLAIIFCWWIAVLVHEGVEKPLLKIFRSSKAAPVREFLSA